MICIYYTVVIPVASCDSQGGGQRRLTAYELAERAGHTKAFVSWIAELNRPSKQLLLKQTIWTNLFLYVSTSFKCFFCFRTLEHRLDSSYEPTRNRESSLWHLDSVFPGTSDWETVETFDSIASDWIIQWIGFWDLSLCFVLLGPDRNYADVCSPVEVVSCRVLPQNHPHVNTWRYLKILEVVVQGSFSSFFSVQLLSIALMTDLKASFPAVIYIWQSMLRGEMMWCKWCGPMAQSTWAGAILYETITVGMD